MIFTHEQKQAAYKKLSPEAQYFIMAEETSELIDSYLKECGLTDEQYNLADSEIMYVMFGLQTLTNTIENIAKISNKKASDLSKLKTNLEENIFKKIGINYEEVTTSNKTFLDQTPSVVKLSNKIFNQNATSKSKTEKQEAFRKTTTAIREKTAANIPELFRTLPDYIQDIVVDSVWKDRTEEIAKKYSLNPTQTETLTSNVLFILTGLDKGEDFLKLMTSELGISKLLADQVIEDLELRVFDYALKTVENKEKRNQKKEPEVQEQKPEKAVVQVIPEKPLVPEVKPVNLPVIEPGEVAHDTPKTAVPRFVPAYKPTFMGSSELEAIKTQEVPRIKYTSSSNTPEPIQRPVSVPRFVPTKVEEPKDVKSQFSAPISQPDRIEPAKPEVKPETEALPVHKYAVDPYREPTN